MTIFQAIILGIVQGLTEFLPISSSAHLTLVPYLLGWTITSDFIFPFDVLVQMGTLVAVIVFFWKDLLEIIKASIVAIRHGKPFESTEARQFWYLILATIPAGLIGLFFKGQVEEAFHSPSSVALFLFGTAALLLVAERIGQKNRSIENFDEKDALWMGVFQAISIFPGISRSGATISGGMFHNLDRPSAARFSFLMSIPIFLAAGLLSIVDLVYTPDLSSFVPVLLTGFLCAGIVGYFSIRWLISYVSRQPLYVFAIYCIMLGGATLLFSSFPSNNTTPVNSSVEVETPYPSPSDDLIIIDRTASLSWLGVSMNECAILTGFSSFIVHVVPTRELDPTLRPSIVWADPAFYSGYIYSLDEETLEVVVNPQNSLSTISFSSLQSILSGSQQNWETDLPSSVNLWLYSDTEDIQQIIQTQLLGNRHPSTLAHLAVSPDSLRNAIALDPTAIGFLPSHEIDNSVRSLQMRDFTGNLTYPIIAVLPSEPTGTFQEWLGCLQQTLSQ